MYTIKQAAELAGITPATLRAWERRYALPAPERSASGYRLYDETALARVRLMNRLVRSGWAPRSAAGIVRQADASLELPSPQAFVDEVIAGVTPGRRDALLAAHLRPGTLAERIDGWLMPMLAALGQAWAQGRLTVWQEHAVASSVLRQLHAAFEALPTPQGPMVLSGLPAGCHHEVGLAAFNVLARDAGLDVIYLGTDLPAEAWAEAARAYRPAAIVLAVPTLDDLDAGRRTLQALTEATPEALLAIGGGAQDALASLAAPLGHSVQAAVAGLAERLGAEARRRSRLGRD